MFSCIGVPGNLFVVVVIFSMTRMRKKVTNMFIISQSCTDLFVAIMLMGEYQPQSELHRTVCGNHAYG